MQDVRRAESLSHFPCVVAPSRSGNENVALQLELQAAVLLSPHYAYQVHWKDSAWHVDECVLHCTLNSLQLHLPSLLWPVSLCFE